MKKILSIILVMMSIVFSSVAQESNNGSSDRPIVLESHSIDNSGNSTRHRAPMRINIEAFYDSDNQTINIIYDGEADGEVLLYLNESVIDYSSEINTSFLISTAGIYKIEIIGETWVAIGYIRL